MAIPPYQKLRDSMTKLSPIPSRILALDPGGTTGASLFLDGDLPTPEHRWQVEGTVIRVATLIREQQPDVVVAEDFILYADKADDQKWNSMDTSRLLGAIELCCWDMRIPMVMYTASRGKRFASNDKLRSWGVDISHARRHSIDSIRHGIEFIIFGRLPEESRIPESHYGQR